MPVTHLTGPGAEESRALLAGIPAQVVAENCGTSIRMIEKHYGHLLQDQARDALAGLAL